MFLTSSGERLCGGISHAEPVPLLDFPFPWPLNKKIYIYVDVNQCNVT